MQTTTTVIILHYGDPEITKNSLTHLAPKLTQYPLIIVNNTTQDISSFKKIIPKLKIINNHQNLGFAKGVNRGIKLALRNSQTDSILLLNNDLTLTFGNISHLRKTLFYQSNIGLVAPVLHHSGNLYDWGGRYNPWLAMVKHQNFKQKPKRPIKVDHVAGAAMLIRRQVLEEVGLFDERFFLYYEDLDFCLRLKKAGYQIIIDPEVVAEHQISASSSPLGRTFYQWHSHLKFIFKHLLSFQVYPTALIYDLIFYPVVTLKLLIKNLISLKS